MGLLDEAIREHLELKRRHGAAEDEVRQQEQEALGPPRRDQVPEPLPAPGASEPALEAPSVQDPAQAAELDPDSEPAPAPAASDLDSPDGAPPAAERASVYEDEPWLEESRPPTPEPEPEEDVLEETPEFLQETPEHDRLWFEQKPPKDFDFDK